MAERKMLSKKTRFEVFKRDKFTCQYCGRMSPDVILEVDHLKPVAKGGNNNMLNLITSCRDCNRGKRDNVLSDDAEIKKQQAQLLDLADKREQLKMMVDWKNELLTITETEIDCIASFLQSISGNHINENGRRVFRKLLCEFSFDEVYNATTIAFSKYYRERCENDFERETRNFNFALYKIGGICYNKRKQREGG